MTAKKAINKIKQHIDKNNYCSLYDRYMIAIEALYDLAFQEDREREKKRRKLLKTENTVDELDYLWWKSIMLKSKHSSDELRNEAVKKILRQAQGLNMFVTNWKFDR